MADLAVDASAVAGWILPDETDRDLGPQLAAEDPVLAPWRFWAELRNILIVGERRGRLAANDADDLIEAVDDLGLTFDAAPSSASVMRLARRHGLTICVGLYLELALRRGAGLVALDRKLAAAADAEGCRAG